ncbi:hypothetical protein WDL1CHR_00691 [Variovorax sp. WDL1]|nr:hypothetical protein CHC07_02932 [Variovorax sp. B4]PNG57937.1 hypothetical protein CHC06_02935 [Variovorax sp. B2]VTV09599.1 hypothetical protein WDL1CHR_00691 [Variovorax sp. WDL1]
MFKLTLQCGKLKIAITVPAAVIVAILIKLL